jgi:CheY-like chemotaxis protein
MARILVIDDDELVRFTLKTILEEDNHEVAVAKDGVEGTALFTSQPYPLVITDLIMPEKEGMETIIELRKNYPDTKIIAISGGGQMGVSNLLKVAQRIGADQAIAKPFGRDEVLDCVKECLES